MKKILLLTIIVLLTGCNEKAEIKSIDCKQKDELLKNNAILIDVRTKEEYNEFHLDNSINIPLDNINTINEKNKSKSIIVYCRSGVRSKNAANELLKMGYKNIYDLGSIEKCK